MNEITRRELFKRGSILAVGLMTPPWLSAIARADILRQAKGGKLDPDNVLVVVQLTGGNDGLNTVVPYASARYRELRPTLGIAEDVLLKLNDRLGLHPALKGLKTLYDEKKVAIIQNVGYPNANRSHFKSMEIWQSASPDTSLKYGWIGRYLDERITTGPLNPVFAVGLSTEKPRALQASNASIPCFASLADIQAMVGDPDAERMMRQIQGAEAKVGSETRLIQQASRSALDAMTVLKDQLGKFQPKEQYGNDPFGQGMKQVAQLVATSPATRVIYLSVGGFDTHARQADRHAELLRGFGDSLLAFQREIEAVGKADKVTVLAFSEFGRRSFENASGGTDHGAAAPMFLVGKQVKGGLHGPIPDLDKLQDGDLPFTTDFRQVYATALDKWMGGDSQKVLQATFSPLELLS